MLLILASSAVSCTLFINHNTPKGYVRYAVSVLDRNGLYADRPEWQEVKAAILAEAKTFTTMDQAHEAVSRAAKVAGGKHSALVPPYSFLIVRMPMCFLTPIALIAVFGIAFSLLSNRSP